MTKEYKRLRKRIMWAKSNSKKPTRNLSHLIFEVNEAYENDEITAYEKVELLFIINKILYSLENLLNV